MTAAGDDLTEGLPRFAARSVSVRVRPLNRQEGQEFFAWKIDGNSIVQLDANTRDVDRTRDTKYGLDHIFGPEWTTQQIYEATTQSLIHKMVTGFNSTVFAYGQTSSGKTHTMRGTPDSPGLIPLAVAEAFRLIESNENREYLIRVSYMELYNEEVNDLLAPENTKLPIHESKENGPYVCGLREDIVTSPEQVLQLLESGETNRHIGSTRMNEKSSRSHTVFRMVVESRAVNAESDDAGAVLVSVLTLVDLAGSERVAKTGAEGIRMKEGTAINKSLLTLGNVINKLSEGALVTGSHIPYRDSKLTRILQPSLGGNAKTAIICAMTPAGCHVEESHSTLRFACRAKRVVNNAIVNEVLSDAAVLKRQAKEIEELKRRLNESGYALVSQNRQHWRASTSAGEDLESALQQKNALAEQAEQAKWQSRQLDKKVDELQAACRASEQEREALKEALAQSQAAAESKYLELSARHKDTLDAQFELKEKLKAIKTELSDTRAKLELRDYEAGMRESKEQAFTAQLNEATARIKERTEEVDSLRRSVKAAEERVAEAEGRARELYECNKRLELHVSELESRKRAPLYQKKQEEELKAAIEKAQECEVRAIEAELRAKDLLTQLEAAQKQLADFQESASSSTRQFTRAQEELAERHALEVQRLMLDGALQQERHEEALAGMRAVVQELEAAKAAVEEALATKAQQLAELQQDAGAMQARITELEAAEAELQACSNAAQEKIALLEHAAEEEAAAHEAMLAKAQHSHGEAMVAASSKHEEEKAALLAEIALNKEAAAIKAELQQQVDDLSVKVQEAAGALKAKEELKEERLRHKQEAANLKAELQKLQLESKTGAKGKDLAQKELDALKKRLTDAEAKLRTALQEKAAAIQEKGNLERQLKQNQSQKLMMEKTLEKKDVLESKKRESIMVNLNKSKEQLNTFEERLKAATVELQKVQMDLLAKQGECSSLESQLQEQKAENGQLRNENNQYALEATELHHKLGCLEEEHNEVSGQLQALTAELESARTSAEQQATEMTRNQQLDGELATIRIALATADEKERAATAQYSAAQELLAATQAQLAAITAERAEALGQVDAAEAQVQKSSADFHTANCSLRELESRLLSTETQFQEATSELEAAQEEQLRAESSAEIAAALQHSNALEAELMAVRQQLMEAQSAAAAVNAVPSDVTRSFSSGGAMRLQVEQRDQMLRLIDELSIQVAATPAVPPELQQGIQEQEERLHAALRDAERLAAAERELQEWQGQAERMQITVDEQATQLQRLSALQRDASSRASEANTALSSLLLRYDELMAQHDSLASELAAKSADADALRQALVQEVEKRKKAEQQGEDFATSAEELRCELARMEDARQALTAEYAQASQRLTSAEAAQNQVQQLQQQVAALQAAVLRLTQEVVTAKEAATASESEAQDLLDANTLLESQIRELRASHAALNARAAASTADAEQAMASAAMATQLRESEALRSKLELQIVADNLKAAAEREAVLQQQLGAIEAEAGRLREAQVEAIDEALLYRLRKDVETAGGVVAAFDNLSEVRALQYEVDRMNEKCKRYARDQENYLAENRRLQELVRRGAGGKAPLAQDVAESAGVLTDKENRLP
ncbi:hypothetical protein GPECTOR_86g388 [Gonium pectorale]|uniref:Kinesin motor domain-containing protein n=1 Tax=Gonium pectorale TaxID=33097 RepID=A0A150G192_GONPE|nr:hypothetical protein GPECTOR_86g388 [Gonium pectorale]|eukprot:KXZ43594.1 hypothetical protein GPECTOR_86g388 [Gonium pectorale]